MEPFTQTRRSAGSRGFPPLVRSRWSMGSSVVVRSSSRGPATVSLSPTIPVCSSHLRSVQTTRPAYAHVLEEDQQRATSQSEFYLTVARRGLALGGIAASSGGIVHPVGGVHHAFRWMPDASDRAADAFAAMVDAARWRRPSRLVASRCYGMTSRTYLTACSIALGGKPNAPGGIRILLEGYGPDIRPTARMVSLSEWRGL